MIFCSHSKFRHFLATIFLLTALPLAAHAATLDVTGPMGASVIVDGRMMGYLPLSHTLALPAGEYEIQSELPGYLPFKTQVTLPENQDWQRLQIRLVPMSKKTAWTSNLLFAGMGQHYMDKSFKGYFFNILEAGGLLTALSGEVQRGDYRKDYLLLKSKYDAAINPNDLEYFKGLTDQAYSDMEDMESLRNTGLMVAGGAIVLSILDAVFLFPGVDIGSGEVPVQTGALNSPFFQDHNNPMETVHASVKLGF